MRNINLLCFAFYHNEPWFKTTNKVCIRLLKLHKRIIWSNNLQITEGLLYKNHALIRPNNVCVTVKMKSCTELINRPMDWKGFSFKAGKQIKIRLHFVFFFIEKSWSVSKFLTNQIWYWIYKLVGQTKIWHISDYNTKLLYISKFITIWKSHPKLYCIFKTKREGSAIWELFHLTKSHKNLHSS